MTAQTVAWVASEFRRDPTDPAVQDALLMVGGTAEFSARLLGQVLECVEVALGSTPPVWNEEDIATGARLQNMAASTECICRLLGLLARIPGGAALQGAASAEELGADIILLREQLQDFIKGAARAKSPTGTNESPTSVSDAPRVGPDLAGAAERGAQVQALLGGEGIIINVNSNTFQATHNDDRLVREAAAGSTKLGG